MKRRWRRLKTRTNRPTTRPGRSNIAALVVIVVLFAGAYWVFNLLERHREIQNCIASGRRDCIEIAPPSSRTP